MKHRKNEVEKIIKQIREVLNANRETDPERISLFNSIIPGCRNPLIVKTPVLVKLSREIWMNYKQELDFILDLSYILWHENEYYEENKIAIFLLEKYVKKIPENILQRIETYFPLLYTWDLVDQFGMRICSELLKNNFKCIKIFSTWIVSSDFWIRRLSLVSLVGLRNKKLTTDQWIVIEKMLKKLWEDDEYYVYKAMAWCLRELSKLNSDKVASFLKQSLTQKSDKKHINRSFIKTCIKKLSSSEQLKILSLL
ncbi:MAG: DNA alkylation repair protein [Candidatus Hodarchaeota archaeon]